ncbi:Transducin/WD40 repeat-like superfamily protein [Quillaja saponaria]|uniref:Transducin/WD40 repeat-like superfamily protein n=1 Tax=Quillaja saponaria TaxID=32244 RepID=A0AAD7PMZ1_QUISA|nr:Transducin/WD40 repeat-like superfamily protein [Quillaja saponaria]KAJ7961484.1 Transducin/WD40 repeat-like superfamily protein [Quillaja saponaria]
MISATSWVPKGVAKSEPAVADPPSKEEIEEIIKSGAFERRDGESEEADEDMDLDANMQGDKVSQALTVADALGKTSKKTTSGTDAITVGLEELDMEHYDEEDESIELFGTGVGDLYYPSNNLDPYLKEKDDEDSEELEDMTINPTDSVIVCARNEDDVNLLEVWILEDSDSGDINMYIHHDIIIPAFPLCTAWLDCPLKGGERGNFVAVGSMEPSIEIWDLDIIDEVQPCMVLGGISEKKKKGKKKSSKYKKDSHTDSVLGLAWNKEYRNILASASADNEIRIWDVAAGKCDITMTHHSDKVQAIAWNCHAPQVLLSGSFDRSVVMKDGRIPEHSGYKWSVTADVESLAWDPHTEHSFVVSLEDGTVKAVSGVSYNPSAPNLLATGSTDKMVKLWDLSNNQPSCIASKNPKAGAVFSVSFSEDNPFLLAIGGSKGKLQVWDTLSDAGVYRKFGNYSRRNKPESRS